MLEGYFAILADEEGFRHAVNAPVNGAAPGLIGSDRVIGVAQIAKETARIFGLVLVVQADDAKAVVLRQRHQHRMLLTTGRAPGRKNVEQGDLAGELRRIDAWQRNTLQGR